MGRPHASRRRLRRLLSMRPIGLRLLPKRRRPTRRRIIMSGRLSRGWAMAKASFAVLKRYPRLAILPMISGAVLWLVIGLIILSMVPVVVSGKTNALGADSTGQVAFYAAFFVALYVLTVIAVFFNVALIFCALRCHAGQEPSIREGLKVAAGRLPQILGWALVSATVG